jgi:hypothetical protein
MYFENCRLDLSKPDGSLTRSIQIHSLIKDKNISDFDNFGGNVMTSQSNVKRVSNYLSNKGYQETSKIVKCYTYNNKKMYIVNNNSSLTKIKQTVIHDFQYADNYLLIVQDEKDVPATQFPIVNNYHSITNYTERSYNITPEITVIFKEYDTKNTSLTIQFKISDELKNHLNHLLKNPKLKQINNLLGEVSPSDTSNKAQIKSNHK